MRFYYIALLAVGVIPLSACASVQSETTFAAEREMLIGSPAIYAKTVSECSASIRTNATKLKGAMLLTGLPADRAATVMCERFTKAHRDGRWTYEEYKAEMTSPGLTPASVRIAQGR